MEKFDGDQPVYIQLVDLFFVWIVSGKLKPGDQIPPVRKLAADLQINPNTVQKSLQLLEEKGIAQGEVGRGRFITQDKEKLEEVKDAVLQRDIHQFISKMKKYKITDEEMITMVKRELEKENVKS